MNREGEHSSNEWLSLGVAFIGGYGDAAGYILAGTFTGHITGNTVLAAISIIRRDWPSAMRRLLAVFTFLLGTAINSRVTHWAEQRRDIPLSVELLFEAVLLGCAALALDWRYAYNLDLFIVLMCLALGFQNGSLRKTNGLNVHTTYMTGMMTHFVERGSDAPRKTLADPTMRLLISVWLWFILGALAGSALTLKWRSQAILVAAALVLGFAVIWHVRQARAAG